MNIIVNGRRRRLEPGTTLRDLVPEPRGVAVALNGAVVPAASWAGTPLSEDDTVELVTAHQGG
jgi:sulfur carrier protein